MIYQQPSGVTVRYIYMSVTVTHCQFTAEMFFACSRLFGPKEPSVFSELTFLKQEQKRRLGRNVIVKLSSVCYLKTYYLPIICEGVLILKERQKENVHLQAQIHSEILKKKNELNMYVDIKAYVCVSVLNAAAGEKKNQ